MGVTFRVLGPVRVYRDGHELTVAAAKPRVVLASLLSASGRTVSVDRLVDDLWDDQPVSSAVRTVRVYVARLRDLLGDDVIVTDGAGYRVDVTAGTLDLLEFEALVEHAHQAEREGDRPEALASLRRALTLWSGEPLANVSSASLHRHVGVALAERRLQVLQQTAEWEIDAGDAGAVVGDLRRLVTDQPLHERSWALLMRALYATGRQAEALEAYQRVANLLADELGVDPGEELRETHRAVLTGTARGEPRELWRPSATPRQLPAETADFVGRETELAVLDTLLEGTRAVVGTIAGPAGGGKTTLAVHWAHRVADHFPDGQLYVNLRGFDPSGQALAPLAALGTFLEVLGVPAERIPTDLDAQASLYRSSLAGRHMLVLLDNARDADQIRPLLPGAPDCLTLVTSRDPLTGLVAGHGAHPFAVGLLSPDEARSFLTRRLDAERVASDPEAADAIVDACAGLPLALAVVAARAALRPHFPLRAIAEELRDAHAGLDAFTVDDAAVDVRAVLSWSYDRLDADAARVFRLLCLHPGPEVSPPAATSLTGVPLRQLRALLGTLTRSQLLAEHAPGRYGWHDLLRAYATELSTGEDPVTTRAEARLRCLDHYLHTAHAGAQLLAPWRDPIDPPGPSSGVVPEKLEDHAAAMSWFAAERGVLVAAVADAAANGHARHAWQLAWALRPFLDRATYTHDLAATHHTALGAAVRLGDAAGQAHILLGLASAYGLRRQFAPTHSHLTRALALFESLGDLVGQAAAHVDLSWTHQEQRQLPEALHHARRAYRLYLEAGHPTGQGSGLLEIGWCHTLLGDYEYGLTTTRQAYDLLVVAQDRHGQADASYAIGYAHHHLGAHDEALASYSRALDLYRELDDPDGAGDALTGLGDIHHAVGDLLAAHAAWREALRLRQDHHGATDELRAKLESMRADQA